MARGGRRGAGRAVVWSPGRASPLPTIALRGAGVFHAAGAKFSNFQETFKVSLKMPRPAILDMLAVSPLSSDEVREYAIVDPLDTIPEDIQPSDEPPAPPDDQLPTLARVDTMRGARLRAVAALARGSSVRQAAIASGVHPEQIRKWMKLPEFVARQKKFEDNTLSRYGRRVNHIGITATHVHEELMAPTLTIAATTPDGVPKVIPNDPELRLKAAARVMTSADRALDRVKGNPDQNTGPLIVFPPGTRIAVLASPSVDKDAQS